MLLPSTNSGLIGEVCDRYPEPVRPPCSFSTETARLLQGKLEHGARHSLIAAVPLRALRGKDHRVVGRLWSFGEAFGHANPSSKQQDAPQEPPPRLPRRRRHTCAIGCDAVWTISRASMTGRVVRCRAGDLRISTPRSA